MLKAALGLLILIGSLVAASAQSKLELAHFLVTLTPGSQLLKEGFSMSSDAEKLEFRKSDGNIRLLIREIALCKFEYIEYYYANKTANYYFFDMNNIKKINLYNEKKYFTNSAYDPIYSRKIFIEATEPSFFVYPFHDDWVKLDNISYDTVLQYLRDDDKSTLSIQEYAKTQMQETFEIEAARTFFPPLDIYRKASDLFKSEHCRGRLF